MARAKVCDVWDELQRAVTLGCPRPEVRQMISQRFDKCRDGVVSLNGGRALAPDELMYMLEKMGFHFATGKGAFILLRKKRLSFCYGVFSAPRLLGVRQVGHFFRLGLLLEFNLSTKANQWILILEYSKVKRVNLP